MAGKVLLGRHGYTIYDDHIYAHHKLSFSQEGEDLILGELIGACSAGFFVDVGAHHPQRFSNTYSLYLRGWRGINIDPLRGVVESFKVVRPRDITLQIGVAPSSGAFTYFHFNEPALNTFSKNLSEERDGVGDFRLVGQEEVAAKPLAEILRQHISSSQSIDVLNVDVEGLDLEVLQSNDWCAFRPKFVLAEELGREALTAISKSPIVCYLQSKGYSPVAKSTRTLFFRDVGCDD